MDPLLIGALLISQIGASAKQYSMKNCGKILPGVRGSCFANMLRAAICTAVSVIIWLIADGKGTNGQGYLIIIAAGIGTAVNLMAWLLCANLISLSLLECFILVGSLILPMLLTPFIFGGESVSPLQWIGCALVLISVILFLEPDRNEKAKSSGLFRGVMIFLAALGAAVSAIFKKLYTFYVEAEGNGSSELYTLLTFAIMLLVFAIINSVYFAGDKIKNVPFAIEKGALKKTIIYISVASIGLYVYELFSTYASRMPAAIFFPLSRGLLIVGTFLLDVIGFGYKATAKKLIGLITVIAAMILVNL